MDALNVQPFERPARLADAHGAMPTARIRSLATRLSAGLPNDNDSSETERAKWVWQLAVLERSVIIRALGFLKAAQADGKCGTKRWPHWATPVVSPCRGWLPRAQRSERRLWRRLWRRLLGEDLITFRSWTLSLM